MQDNAEPLNKRLERLRRGRGLTAKAMTRQIGVPESTYREWEYGRGLKIPPFQKISEALAISVTEILTGQQPTWQRYLEELEAIEKSIRKLKETLSSLI